MRKLSRRDLLRTSAAAGGLMLVGCGPGTASPTPTASSAATIAATATPGLEALAKAEGSVLFYTLDNVLAADVTKGFKAAYPWADVQTFVGNAGSVSSKVIVEAQSGVPTADVMMLPGPQRQALLKNNVVTTAKIPSEAKLPAAYLDTTGYAHPIYATLITLIYNTNLASAGPKTIEELADPSWKSKIAMDPPANGVLAPLLLASQRKAWGDAKWNTWLQGIKANSPLFTPDAGSGYQAVLRGERTLSVDTYADLSRQAAGTPMKTDWYPRIVTSTQFVWLSSKARHPNAGTLLIDWLQSDPGQRVIAAGGRSPVLDIDTPVSISKIVPANATFTPVSDLQDFYENTSTYVDMYKALFGG